MKKILRAILSNDAPWDWFTRARIPFPFAVRILRELQDGGYIHYEGDTTKLTDKGSALASELRVEQRAEHDRLRTATAAASCGNPCARSITRFCRSMRRAHAGENPDLDQGAMTPESFFRRLALMIHMGDIQGNRIVNLGDDDFASIAIALTGLAESITVLEIDPRIRDYIAGVAREHHLPITVREQDLTKHAAARTGRHVRHLCLRPAGNGSGALVVGGKRAGALASGRRARGLFWRDRHGSILGEMGALAKAIAESPTKSRLRTFSRRSRNMCRGPTKSRWTIFRRLRLCRDARGTVLRFIASKRCPPFNPRKISRRNFPRYFILTQEGYYEAWK